MMRIKKPTLLVDEGIARRNIRRMVSKATKNGISLRPHFKTHQSKEVGEWYREAGVSKIAVSSVSMAQYFQNHDWHDITIAFPYNPPEAEDINALSGAGNINILITSREAFEHARRFIHEPVGYFIKIDVGNRRTGLQIHESDLVRRLMEASSAGFRFQGLLAHAGHSYHARSQQEIIEVYEDSMRVLRDLSEQLDDKPYISFGDTPTASVVERFDGIDEMRPGNFVFYDAMQYQIGACQLSDVAVAMACPVVAKHEQRAEAVIYGGGVHFSKDRLKRADGSEYYGEVVRFSRDRWHLINGEAFLDRISQEHGIMKGSSRFIAGLNIGDVIGVLPVHSCMTVDLMPGYFTFDGKPLTKLSKSI